MNADSLPATAKSRSSASGVERRTIIRGAAWSIPVIAAASAVPLAAASVKCDPSSFALTPLAPAPPEPTDYTDWYYGQASNNTPIFRPDSPSTLYMTATANYVNDGEAIPAGGAVLLFGCGLMVSDGQGPELISIQGVTEYTISYVQIGNFRFAQITVDEVLAASATVSITYRTHMEHHASEPYDLIATQWASGTRVTDCQGGWIERRTVSSTFQIGRPA